MLHGGSVDGSGVTCASCGEICRLSVAFATTWQLAPFSQPQPSPSTSNAAELHGGGVPEVTVLRSSFAGVELAVGETTTQLLLFSHPQPSPSWSEEDELQVVIPLIPDSLPVVELPVPLVPDDASIIQLALFSQPHPSPSGSAPGELQIVVDCMVGAWIAVPDTLQLSPFSQPHPSPSLSEVELTQIGVFANVAEENAKIAIVGMRHTLSIFMSARIVQLC